MSDPSTLGLPARLAALRRTALLGAPADAAFDRLTRLVARVLDVPIAVISLVDDERIFFLSGVGLDEPWASTREAPLSHSFCRHVVETAGAVVVPDARVDPRGRDNPAVLSGGLVAYAGIPLRSAEGHVLGCVAAIDLCAREWSADDLALLEDVAAGVMTETELRWLARRNDAVLGAIEEGVALVGPDGRILVANARMEQIVVDGFGVPVNGTIYDRMRTLAEHTDERDSAGAYFDRIEADPSANGRMVFTHTLSARAFESFTTPMRDPNGAVIGRVFTLREITAEIAADRLKAEIVSTVSHELRTPLASVLGFAELMSERDLDPETRARFTRTILAEGRRLTGLVDDFLDLQQIEAGRFEPNVSRFDVAVLLREQVDLFQAGSDALALALDAGSAPLVVAADRGQVAQVVGNLLANAIKFSPDGGRVAVTARSTAGSVRVEVADEGIGIPSAKQAEVFKRFFRADPSDTQQIGGAGLGLALARELVARNGGTIGFESAEGEGSTFWLELPLPPDGA